MKEKINNGKVTVFYSTIEDGNMSEIYEDEKTVIHNKETFFKSINIDIKSSYRLKILNDDKITLLNKYSDRTIKTDAIIITIPHNYVYLGFADCIPLVAFDEERNILAFAHLGWRSICKKLHIKVIDELISNFSCNINNIYIYIGPSIKAESYILHNPVQLSMDEWQNYINSHPDGYMIDLVQYINDSLIEYGIRNHNITISKINTASNKMFYSHYRSKHNHETEGRFIFGVGINI